MPYIDTPYCLAQKLNFQIYKNLSDRISNHGQCSFDFGMPKNSVPALLLNYFYWVLPRLFSLRNELKNSKRQMLRDAIFLYVPYFDANSVVQESAVTVQVHDAGSACRVLLVARRILWWRNYAHGHACYIIRRSKFTVCTLKTAQNSTCSHQDYACRFYVVYLSANCLEIVIRKRL